MGEKMEGIKKVNEVEFEEVKKPGFLERFKSLFRGEGKKMVTVQPEIGVETFKPVPVVPEIEKTQEGKLGGFTSFFKRTKKEMHGLQSERVEPVAKIPEIKPLNSGKTERRITPMVRIVPKEETPPVAGEEPLVEVFKPVKLERSILGFDEEKEIAKLESGLRKTRLLFEKKLKEKIEELEKRKGEIEQTMILESHARREAGLNRKEEMLNKKEKEIDAVIRSHQLGREEELNRRERELIMKEKELGGRVEEKIDEEVKKLLKVLDELLGKLPKEVIDKFVKSEEYNLYEKVLERYGV